MERRKSGEGSESGFTLIELLIVIVVLGILAAIVVFSLTGVSGQSKAAACTSDGKSVEIAADTYQAAKGSYPTSTGVLYTTYLHSWPGTGNGYSIGLDTVSDTVTVAIPATSTTSVPYTSTAGCQSLGS